MSFDNPNIAPAVVPEQNESHLRLADEAMRTSDWSVMNKGQADTQKSVLANDASLPDMELTGHHRHHGGYYPYPYPFGHPVGHPTSRVNAFQYTVHDGKISVIGR